MQKIQEFFKSNTNLALEYKALYKHDGLLFCNDISYFDLSFPNWFTEQRERLA